ncbi:MAG: hypothetical protein ACKVHU_14480 [Acidimicrobiales bacterium]
MPIFGAIDQVGIGLHRTTAIGGIVSDVQISLRPADAPVPPGLPMTGCGDTEKILLRLAIKAVAVGASLLVGVR